MKFQLKKRLIHTSNKIKWIRFYFLFFLLTQSKFDIRIDKCISNWFLSLFLFFWETCWFPFRDLRLNSKFQIFDFSYHTNNYLMTMIMIVMIRSKIKRKMWTNNKNKNNCYIVVYFYFLQKTKKAIASLQLLLTKPKTGNWK